MQLSRKETEWLQLAIEDNNKYHIPYGKSKYLYEIKVEE